jgi:hypothetical protein
MNRLFTLTLFCFSALLTLANKDLERINYNWDENPTLSQVNFSDTNISVVFLKNVSSREFINEARGFFEYVLVHKKIKLLTDRGIENYNKVYLPAGEKSDILIEKARVINSKGEVINLKESDIKEGTTEGGSKFRYFAFDGVDIQSEIEYIYLYRKMPAYRGSLQNIQMEYPQENVLFEVITPAHLVFEFKSYNGLPKVSYDSTLATKNEKKRWFIELDKVERLPAQRSSAHEAHLQYVGYKLWKNLANGSSDMFSYGELSGLVYKRVYQTLSKKDDKFIKTLNKKMDLSKLSKEEVVRKIEQKLKSHLHIIEASLPDNIDLQVFWDNKIANEQIALIIFANLLKLNNIETEIILTCDRFEMKFDKEYENWAFAKSYALYFPELKKYTSLGQFTRLGLPDYSFIHNHGLFIRTVKVGDQEYGAGKIKHIPHNDYKNSGDTLRVFARLDGENFDQVSFDVYHSLTGYKASYYQPILEYIEDHEDREELQNHLLNFLDEDGEVVNLETEHFGTEHYGVNPLIAKGELKSGKFFEKARNNYVFKVGELIGPQMQMYHDSLRRIPIEDYHTRHYHREISFEVPQGYKLKNADQLALHEFYKNAKGETTMEFVSSYKMDGNKVVVTVMEYYKELEYPLDIYEDYRRVINAAADFNKLTVIFEKI